MSGPGVLLIDLGDLPSLAATTLEWRPHHVAIYHHRGADGTADRRHAAVREHGEALACEHVIVDRLPPLEVGGVADGGPDEASVLLRAAAAAVRLGCRRILWPCQVGPQPEPLGRVVQQADAAAALAELALTAGPVGGVGPGMAGELVVDVPLADLTDAQVVEVAEQGGAPLRGFWPCLEAGPSPCGRCGGCRRWLAAFDAAAVAWPW